MTKTHRYQNDPKTRLSKRNRGKRIDAYSETDYGNLTCGSCGKKTRTLYSKDHEMMCWECQK